MRFLKVAHVGHFDELILLFALITIAQHLTPAGPNVDQESFIK